MRRTDLKLFVVPLEYFHITACMGLLGASGRTKKSLCPGLGVE